MISFIPTLTRPMAVCPLFTANHFDVAAYIPMEPDSGGAMTARVEIRLDAGLYKEFADAVNAGPFLARELIGSARPSNVRHHRVVVAGNSRTRPEVMRERITEALAELTVWAERANEKAFIDSMVDELNHNMQRAIRRYNADVINSINVLLRGTTDLTDWIDERHPENAEPVKQIDEINQAVRELLARRDEIERRLCEERGKQLIADLEAGGWVVDDEDGRPMPEEYRTALVETLSSVDVFRRPIKPF